MGRQYKFRAWNKKKGIMNYDNEDGTEDYWDGICTSEIGMVNALLNIPDKDDQYSISSFRNKYEVMQYTGLKDKNGVEIYEGDIVTGEWVREIYQVIFSDGDDIGSNAGEYYNWVYGFVPAHADGSVDDNGRCEFMYEQMILGSAEVIGNIYENSELLEAEQWQ